MIKKVADTLRKDFQVDLLKSVQHEQTAIKLMKDATVMCAGGFWLIKSRSGTKAGNLGNRKDSWYSLGYRNR